MQKLLNIFGNLKSSSWLFLRSVSKAKTNFDFQKTFDNPLAKYLNMATFLAIYQCQSNHCRLVFQNTFFFKRKTNFMAPFYGWK